jgi:hypothetical protein
VINKDLLEDKEHPKYADTVAIHALNKKIQADERVDGELMGFVLAGGRFLPRLLPCSACAPRSSISLPLHSFVPCDRRRVDPLQKALSSSPFGRAWALLSLCTFRLF